MMVLERMSFVFSFIAVGIYLVSFLVEPSTGTCLPAEEEEEYNITWSPGPPSSYISNIRWDVYFRNGTVVELARCTYFGDCTSYFPDYFDISNTEKNSAILIIKNVSRIEPFDMETVDYWKVYSYNISRIYILCHHLQIFVRPKLVCEQPRLISSEFSVEVNCSSERTYPAPKCQALISNDNEYFTTVESIDSESQRYYDETGLEYYTATCSFTLSLGQFETHGQYLKIKMYPNLKYISNVEDYGDGSDVFDIASLLVTDCGDSTASPDSTGDNDDGDDDTDDDDNNDSSDDSSLALGLGIPLAIMIVLAVALAVVLAVLLYRHKHALEYRLIDLKGLELERGQSI